MIKKDPIELVKAYLAAAGKEVLMKDADLFKALVKYATYNIEVVKIHKSKHPKLDVLTSMNFMAFFTSRETSEIFMAMLVNLDYGRVSCSDSSEILFRVDFEKRIDGFNLSEVNRYSLEVGEIIHRLGGVYGNWLVPHSNGSIEAPRTHTDAVTGIKWHRYTKSYDSYPEVAWFLYKPAHGFTYAEDEQQEEFFSKLKKRDVTALMKKLRAGEGRIPTAYLSHFEDKHIEEVKEILEHGYYTDAECDLFTEVALKQFRMGREQLAIELALHGVLNGEGYEQFNEDAKEQDEEMGTNFARDFSRTKTYRDLQVQMGENSTASSKAKLKV